MDYFSENVAYNLKRIRNAQKMSLDVVAEQTGISKSMLGQIERGESNPTIATLGKIVSGLRIPFSALLSSPKSEVITVQRSTLGTMREFDENASVYTYFPYEEDRDFEIYTIEVFPHAKYTTGSHGDNTLEYATVFQGSMRLEVDGRTYEVREGDAIRFHTDKQHTYENTGDNLLILHVVFTWV